MIGIVLAGGRSSRFGRDKLAEPLDDGPLVWRSIRALYAAGCREAIVVLGPAGEAPACPPELDRGTIRFVRDGAAFEGPLAGLATGLRFVIATAADERVALVVGGDQPDLVPGVLSMLGRRVGTGSAVAVLVDPTGRVRPLPMAVGPPLALEAADRILARGSRRLRDLLAEIPTAAVAPAAWLQLDPTGSSLRDVDVPDDLDPRASTHDDGPPAAS